ncbi:uncharacterized protein LOC111626370 [Centruroides sculpturatus]|uniref:uncharacterized protein LOC111626370 n=1 Tax=Centruroides sculpturatus TaxID=218467 RepID=UPI000C6E147E|nr:uncharacterized protein LOC111626370 [Centruroides sculpturatus]
MPRRNEYSLANEINHRESRYRGNSEINNRYNGSSRDPFYSFLRTVSLCSSRLDCTNRIDANRSMEPQIVSPLTSFRSNGNPTSRAHSYDGSYLRAYTQYCSPVITSYGTISIRLQRNIRVDITVDKAVRVVNLPGRCVAAINCLGDRSCIVHPSCKILQEGVTVNMEIGNRLVKFSKRGITFTSLGHSLVYLVDASGTKSTVEYFRSFNYDVSSDVFFTKSTCGKKALNNCFLKIENFVHRYKNNGNKIWIIADVCIQQNLLGDVCVTRDFSRRVIHTSPTLGTMSVSTPCVYMAAGCDPERYVFVQRGKKKLNSHVRSFKVKNGTQVAGYDCKGKLILH